MIDTVTDTQILHAYRFLASQEGVFCEPASAAGVAGLLKISRQGRGVKGTIVCVLTGHGLKDPDTAKKSPCKKRLFTPGRRFRL
jgi:threonine synthase